MSFRFNFSEDDDAIIETEVQVKEKIQWVECEEIKPKTPTKKMGDDERAIYAKMFISGDVEIGHVAVNEALKSITEDTIASDLAKDENSDLVPGKYEGGLKIWECTSDLIEYLIVNEDKRQMKGLKVLDLGCGAGILGIYTFLNGSSVTFQDYNREVIKYFTIPNVLLNIEEDNNKAMELKKCRFFSGDWASFNDKLCKSEVFDLILTSETIYNETNYNKLINLFKKRLSVNGTVYVAAKTCYFGVGGGVRQFESALNLSGSLKCEVCWKNTNGIQREILKITKT